MTIMFQDDAKRALIEAAYERFFRKIPGATRRTLSTRHGNTHVLVAGPEHGEPLVVVHGALASSAHMVGELAALTSRYRVYAPDVLGQSVKSEDKRLPLDTAAYGEWLTDVLDGLGLQRVNVFGVSWGGFVACKLAALAPSRIDKLVLLVPAGFVNGSAWQGFTKVGLPLALYRAFPSEARLRRFARGILSTMDEAWLEYFGEAFRAYKLDIRVPPLFTPEALREFTRPVLVFGAKDDITFPGTALVARAKTLFPHAETELLENCRHSPPTDDAFRAHFGERVSRFLAGPSAVHAPAVNAIST